MDTRTASPPSSAVASPSPPWRLSERRRKRRRRSSSRKAGSANIFGDVNLCQLQRLFQAAGDQDAEQRAQLVWGHGDETELAQALKGLRGRTRRRVVGADGREVLGSHWLRAFNHLRIDESSPSGRGKDLGEDRNSEAGGAHGSPETRRHTSTGTRGIAEGPTSVLTENQGCPGASERPASTGSGLRRVGENSERYLHRILH
ncbi:uncharacterized protein AB9W97_018986 [Spinachia spinachia]